MSLNIPKGLLDVSESANIIFDTRTFSVQIRKAVTQYVCSGIIKGNGLSANIARYVLTDLGKPFICLDTRARITWKNLPLGHPIRGALTACAVASTLRLTTWTESEYVRRYAKEWLTACTESTSFFGWNAVNTVPLESGKGFDNDFVLPDILKITLYKEKINE